MNVFAKTVSLEALSSTSKMVRLDLVWLDDTSIIGSDPNGWTGLVPLLVRLAMVCLGDQSGGLPQYQHWSGHLNDDRLELVLVHDQTAPFFGGWKHWTWSKIMILIVLVLQDFQTGITRFESYTWYLLIRIVMPVYLDEQTGSSLTLLSRLNLDYQTGPALRFNLTCLGQGWWSDTLILVRSYDAASNYLAWQSDCSFK